MIEEQNTQPAEKIVSSVSDANVLTKTVDELVDVAKRTEEATASFLERIRETSISFVGEHIAAAGEDEQKQVDFFQLALSAVLTGCALESSRAIGVLACGSEDRKAELIAHFVAILNEETGVMMREVVKMAQHASDEKAAEQTKTSEVA